MTLFHADKARSAGSTPPPACQRKKNPLFQSISKSFNEILKYSYNCIGKLKGFCVSLRSPISLLQNKTIF